MPSTTANHPGAATGWVDSDKVLAAGGGNANDRSFSPSSPTGNLVCSGFGLTAGGHASGINVTVDVAAKITNEGLMTVALARNGVLIAAIQQATVSSAFNTYTFSGWAGALTDNDIRNLQVLVYCNAFSDSFCYVDEVIASAQYPAGDATPDAFSFGSASGVAFSTVQTSAPATLAGFSSTAAVSVTNGQYEKNGSGVWTSADGTAVVGDVIKLRHTSPATGLTAKTTTIVIGGTTATFTTTTLAADAVPDAFTFTALTNVERSISVTSSEITVAGINVSTAISITGGEYQIDGGSWTSAAGTITVGKKVKVRQTTSALFSTLTAATLTIGGVAGAFNITTKASVSTPTPFNFVNQQSVTVSTLIVSNTITVAGLDASVNVTVTGGGGEYSKNGGAYSSSATTCVNGDTFSVRHTSAAGAASSVITTLVVGNFAESFCTTTAGADITPAAFPFPDSEDVGVGRVIASSAVTISGINVSTPVNVTNGMVSVNGAAYARYGAITSGQTLAVKVDAIYQTNGTKIATITVGETQATFTATATSDYYIAL